MVISGGLAPSSVRSRRRARRRHEERGDRLCRALELRPRRHFVVIVVFMPEGFVPGTCGSGDGRRGAGRGRAPRRGAPPAPLGKRSGDDRATSATSKSFGGSASRQSEPHRRGGRAPLDHRADGAGRPRSSTSSPASSARPGSIALFDRESRWCRTAAPASRHRRTYQIITLFSRETRCAMVPLSLLGFGARLEPFVRLGRQQALIHLARAALDRVGLGHIAVAPLAQTSYGDRAGSISPWRWPSGPGPAARRAVRRLSIEASRRPPPRPRDTP